MNQEDTICYKVSRCLDMVDRMIQRGEADPTWFADQLHKIRVDAQNMENALKIRKKVMVEAGIEEQYQKTRKKELTPPGINKIAHEEQRYIKDDIDFDVRVTRVNGLKSRETIYHNTVKAGVLCFVERISDIDEFGAIEGQTQKLTFGHPLASWFAFDQLKIDFEARGVEIMTMIGEAVQSKAFKDKRTKNKVMSALQAMNIGG